MDERQAASDLFTAIAGEAPFDGLVDVTLNATVLEGMGECTVEWSRDGDRETGRTPRSALRIIRELRKDMATPQGGAWFTAKFVWTPAGEYRATFDYDSRPQWRMGVDPDSERRMIIEDFEAFPRSPEATPEWLSDIINSDK